MIDIIQNCIWFAIIDFRLLDYKLLSILNLFASLFTECLAFTAIYEHSSQMNFTY
jgi:hypothetical protein